MRTGAPKTVARDPDNKTLYTMDSSYYSLFYVTKLFIVVIPALCVFYKTREGHKVTPDPL